MSSPLAKNISLCLSGKSSLQARPVPSHHEGRLAIVTKRGAGCGGRLSRSQTKGARGGRRSRVVLTPRRWRQVSREFFPRSDGDKQARSPGRARRKPLKPLRRECRVFRCPRGDYARVLPYFRTRGCGRIARPAFPAPSDFLGEWLMQNSGAIRAAGMCLRVDQRMKAACPGCGAAQSGALLIRGPLYAPDRRGSRLCGAS